MLAQAPRQTSSETKPCRDTLTKRLSVRAVAQTQLGNGWWNTSDDDVVMLRAMRAFALAAVSLALAGGCERGRDAGGLEPARAHVPPPTAEREVLALAAPSASPPAAKQASASALHSAGHASKPQPTASTTNDSPFGIAASHLSSKRLSAWLPTVSSAGVSWLRGFDVSALDARLTEAANNHVNVAGILLWGPRGEQLTFPVDDLAGWSAHVTRLVRAARGRVRHWEVWNEPPNFTRDKSPASYAKIVATAYTAAKAVDPGVQIGIAAKSNHLQWLRAAIEAGAKDHFDYVTLHPYEVLDAVPEGGEALFLNIVPTVRAMLNTSSPSRANVPIWFTELGTPVTSTTSPELQASRLLKAYTLGIAQGAARVHWFEGQDGDSGAFGLLDEQGSKRASFTALSTLIETVGRTPNYLGWTTPTSDSYGFVFRTGKALTMVAWTRPKLTAELSFEQRVQVIDPTTGHRTRTARVRLTDMPVLIFDLDPGWANAAIANHLRPFPWGGDFTTANAVSLTAPNVEHGLHQFGSSTIRVFNGKPARDASDRTSQNFAVDPNFVGYPTGPLRISVTVRRNGATPAGFKLEYESTTGYKIAGGWYTVPEGEEFTTKEFTLVDALFVGNWAYHFRLDSDSRTNSQYSIQSVMVTKLAGAPL